MSQRYAISGLDEARAYLADPVLGPRLKECISLAMASGHTALHIFGPTDAQKLHSSLTLFASAAKIPLFIQALEHFFGGEWDEATLTQLET